MIYLLGAIATLPGSKSTNNYAAVFRHLVSLIKKHCPKKLKLDTLVTDDSNSEMTGIAKAFSSRVHLRNRLWHKHLIFEKHWEVEGVNGMVETMYTYTEEQIFGIFVSFINLCDGKYQELLKLQKKKTRKQTHFHRTMYERNVTKKNRVKSVVDASFEQQLELYYKGIDYIHNLYKTRLRWALCHRIQCLKLSKEQMAELAQKTKGDIERLNLKYPYHATKKKVSMNHFKKILKKHKINFEEKYYESAIEREVLDAFDDVYQKRDALEAALKINDLVISTQASETMHSIFEKHLEVDSGTGY